jgi:hypothetical protein
VRRCPLGTRVAARAYRNRRLVPGRQSLVVRILQISPRGRDHGRAAQPMSCSGLTLKSCEAIWVSRKRLGKDPDRDFALQPRVARYTSPMRLRPMAETISYGPSRVPVQREICLGKSRARRRSGRNASSILERGTRGPAFEGFAPLPSMLESPLVERRFIDVREQGRESLQNPTAHHDTLTPSASSRTPLG